MNPPRLLVVDDNADNRAVLTRRFERRGYAVTGAEDGPGALALIGRQSFDLILLDLMMPGMSGIEVLRTLRAEHSASILPVIMVTARGESETMVEAFEQGANDYVTKPVDFQVALARVRTQLARKQAEDALRAVNDELEQRVALRTADLAETNRQLLAEVDERRRVEAELCRAKEAAEDASRLKSQFLATMSHELRTPLNAIIGFSEILADRVVGAPIGAQDLDYAGDINASGRHLLDMVNNILDLSRIEAGTVELREGVICLAALAAAAIRMLAPLAVKGGVGLSTRIDRSLLLHADESMTKRILLNLLSNAVKFTPEGGRVELTAAVAPDGSLRIRVADTGIGIAAADIPRALAVFAQVDNSLARRHEGTGLGLPLAKSLAELHGGRLEIASAPGVGTTVTVVLPASRVHRQADLQSLAG